MNSMASSTCGVIRRRQWRHGAASVANPLCAGNPETGARMVWRTVSATSVEMATILFGITTPLVCWFWACKRASKILPVHLSLIMYAVLSGFRIQTRKNPTGQLSIFLSEDQRKRSDLEAALNSGHRGGFSRNVRSWRGNAHDAENVNESDHYTYDDRYRKHPCHPQIDRRRQLNGFER